MDGRIIDVTDKLMRDTFKLSSNYVAQSCSVKANSVDIVMSTELIELKAKFPRQLIEDLVDEMEMEAEYNSRDVDTKEEEEYTEPAPVEKPVKKISKKKK